MLTASAVMGTTADGLPHCGRVSWTQDHFMLAEFNGGGMSLLFLIGKGIAKMIREGVEFEDSGIQRRIFKPTKERLQDDVTSYIQRDGHRNQLYVPSGCHFV